MKIIYFLMFVILLSNVFAVDLDYCVYIDSKSNVDYDLTQTLTENVSITSCLHIEDSLNLNIYCHDNIISGYSNRGAVIVDNSYNIDFYNCDFRFGDSSDGLVYFSNSNESGVYNSLLNLHGIGNYNPGLQIYNSHHFISSNTTFLWNDTRFPALYVYDSDFGLYNDLYVYSGKGGVDDGEGVYIRTGDFNNITNTTSWGSREYGWRISGDNNYISYSNSSLNDDGGFEIEGDNNTFLNCKSSYNNDDGFLIGGSSNILINTTTEGDVLIPSSADECGIQLEGDYNYITNLFSDSNDRCSLSFEGNYNIVNDSIIYVESNQSSIEGGLIKFEGTYNDLRYSFITINTTAKVFYMMGSNNEIFNNYFYINKDSTILNISPNNYNYFYRLLELGNIIYPSDNENIFIGGNYWENDSGGYSTICTDSNHNGFCDSPFILNENNASDLYPITDQWECNPNDNLTIMNVTPDNKTAIVGESIIISMSQSYTTDTTSDQNCSKPNGISFIDCSYNNSDDIEITYWWGEMNDTVYNTCVGIGSYECNRTKDWKSDRNITSNTVHTTFASCWTRNYGGGYIDLDGYHLEWLPSNITAILSPKPSTDADLNWDTCNHLNYDNATICMSALNSYTSSPIITEKPILSCYDWNNDGIYDDAYISTGESFYVNQSCPGNPDIHNELWNTTVCVTNNDLSDSGIYWGEGYVKLLVANAGGVLDTTKEYLEFFDDFSETVLHKRPYEVDLRNIIDNNNESVFITLKGNESYIKFNANATYESDPVECVQYTIVSLAYDPSIVDYCVYNNSAMKGTTGCNCVNGSGRQGYYDLHSYPTNFTLYLDYNYSRYGFNMTTNTSGFYSANLGLPYYYTSTRSVNVFLTESNGCYSSILNDFSFVYFLYFDGICNDSEWDYFENPIDYGGYNDKCGTCFDDLLSPLINETGIDYGGYFCGYCKDNVLKSNDEIWLLLKSFMNNNDTLGGVLNKTVYGWIPFDSQWCNDAEGTLASINSMIGSALLMLLLVLIIVLLFIGFSLFFSGFFWFKLFKTILKNRKKK